MSANSFGHIFKFYGFGESHGASMGAVIEGCPSGVPFSLEDVKRELNRRRPGRWPWSSPRKEPDEPEILSGVFEGKTLGTPIGILVRNRDARPQDYETVKEKPRTGHADDLWRDKFGHWDHRGGGRASGRETLSRVLAGSVARTLLKELCPDFRVMAFVRQIGNVFLKDRDLETAESLFSENILSEKFSACLPHKEKSEEAVKSLLKAKEEGNSLGSLVELWIEGLPRGLGQPVFHKFKSDLAQGLMSLGASSGVEMGKGLSAASEAGHVFHQSSANYGGLRGGLTTGEKIILRMAFKPPSTLGDMAKKGRHDPCIGPRAVPVVEAMACLVSVDHLLWSRLDRLEPGV